MSLRELRYLIALADCLSFSRAAERCAVTQSTLSIQIRKLEDYLGVVLIERSRSHVALTPQGREVVRLAQRVVAGADDILTFTRREARARANQHDDCLEGSFDPGIEPDPTPSA